MYNSITNLPDRMQGASAAELQLIHDASIEILQREGVCFNNQDALDIFVKRGYSHNNGSVLISEKQVLEALATAPSSFTLHARNHDHHVKVGGRDHVLLPTVGAPNVADRSGEQRPATLDDFRICCDLVQTSDQLGMGGYLMVQPHDVPLKSAHLDMMLTYLTRSDKPILGAFGSKETALDTFNMTGRIFGGMDYLLDHPVAAMIVNTLTPLQFAGEQTDVLMTAARYRQPVVISNMALAGSSAPVQLPGLLALINAEILAGLVLSQVVGPGTPVIYGTTSAPMDMKSTVGVVGAWETVKIAATAIQMSQFYDIPCRTGGALTDANAPDAQAAVESSIMMSTVLRNGAHFILHGCGQISSFMALSFEKWLIDEELCSLVRNILSPMRITKDTIDLETICDVSAAGNFLSHPSTFKNFKQLSRSELFNRNNVQRWRESGAMDCTQAASINLEKRLNGYTPPHIDDGLKQDLDTYVTQRKSEILG